MGEESIIAPPRSKNMRSTGTSAAAAAVSGGTLKVIQLPTPIADSVSPVAGIARLTGVEACAEASRGQIGSALTASARRNRRRVDGGGPGVLEVTRPLRP